MKNKFSRNDKFIVHAFVLVDVISVLILISVVVVGILVISIVSAGNPLIIFEGIVVILLAAPISSFCFLVFGKVVLNAFCDLKLIRNKLYGLSNDDIKKLTSYKDEDREDISHQATDGESYIEKTQIPEPLRVSEGSKTAEEQ